MNIQEIQQMTHQELLDAYIAADKARRANNGSWRTQCEISNKLNDLGYYVYYHYKNADDYSQYRLEKREGYWSNGKKWSGDVIKEGWQ